MQLLPRLNNFEPLLHSILVYLGLFFYLGLFWPILWYISLSWYRRVSRYLGLSQTNFDYLQLSPTISDYF